MLDFEGYIIPRNIQNALTKYVEDRIEPNSFLMAVLTKQFVNTICRAPSLEVLQQIVLYVYNELPETIIGSEEAVANHIKGA